MPCEHRDGMIICTRGGQRAKACETCGHPASIQCDWPVRRNGHIETCDRWCCRQHARNVSLNVDYCLPHSNMGAPKL